MHVHTVDTRQSFHLLSVLGTSLKGMISEMVFNTGCCTHASYGLGQCVGLMQVYAGSTTQHLKVIQSFLKECSIGVSLGALLLIVKPSIKLCQFSPNLLKQCRTDYCLMIDGTTTKLTSFPTPAFISQPWRNASRQEIEK